MPVRFPRAIGHVRCQIDSITASKHPLDNSISPLFITTFRSIDQSQKTLVFWLSGAPDTGANIDSDLSVSKCHL